MKKVKGIILGSIGALVAFILIIGSFTTVSSGEVGVRTRFGKVVGTTNEGVNFKIPFIEKIERMNIKVQKIEVQTSSSSKDLQEVNMSLAVNYRIDSKEVKDLYKNVGKKYKDVVLEPAIQESIKAVTSKYTAEQLITSRSQVSDECMEELTKKVEKYGIIINDFNITNFSFSAEFDKAIEEKQVAEQKVLTAKQELEREKIEAEKKIVAAEAEKKANDLKEKSLTNNIIKEKFIEKWDGKLPTVYGGSNILDVSNIIK
jgi:regulator of protease activity HflC (stomatin/prohibitin superfamily)